MVSYFRRIRKSGLLKQKIVGLVLLAIAGFFLWFSRMGHEEASAGIIIGFFGLALVFCPVVIFY